MCKHKKGLALKILLPCISTLIDIFEEPVKVADLWVSGAKRSICLNARTASCGYLIDRCNFNISFGCNFMT